MKRFVRFCLILVLPIIIMIAFYVWTDPFKVIWHYDLYYTPDNFIGLNQGFVSAKHYDNHREEYGYNSFIFGNSRSIAYYVDEWKKYLPESSACYHFDANGGSVGELFHQIKYVSEQGKLQNALLVLDLDLLSRSEMDGILFACPPIIKENKGLLKFHKEYFMSFYGFEFLSCFIDYKVSKEYKPYMGFYIQDPQRAMGYDPINNELRWDKQEESIANGLYFDANRINGFKDAQFPGMVSKSVLDDDRKNMLSEVSSIFEEQHTNYRIIISPIFNQVKINPNDLRFLIDVFGQNNVFDFSGANQWNADYHNYYETSHYRPCVANDLMQIVYSDTSIWSGN